MQPIDGLLNGVHSATVTDISVLVREVRVRIGVLSRYVTIRIYDTGNNAPEPYVFETSATMRTPAGQPPREEPRTAATENEALRRAVRTLTQDYEEAVRRGEMPDDGWLIQPSSAAQE